MSTISAHWPKLGRSMSASRRAGSRFGKWRRQNSAQWCPFLSSSCTEETMSQNRREFLERITASAMLASVPFSPDVLREFGALSSARGGRAEEFDLTWVDKV